MITTLSTPRKQRNTGLHLSPSLGLKQNSSAISDFTNNTRQSPQRSPRRQRRPAACDRFIPKRLRPGSSSYDTQLCPDEQLGLAAACGAMSTKVLEFQRATPQSTNSPLELCRPYLSSRPQVAKRTISHTPERVLDAPGIRDDFYLNLLSWSKRSQLAIALNSAVYIWDNTLGASQLTELDDGYVSSVQFNRGHHLGVANSDGSIMIFDANTGQKLRTMRRHITPREQNRTMSLAWNANVLSSGNEAGKIWHHDLRVAEHNIMQLGGHTDAVCGLSYRGQGSMLASGSRDKTVKLWDCRVPTPKFTLTAHNAAVKALAWSPRQENLLATGGGSSDRQIHFWNTTTGTRLHSIDTESQVSSIHWSEDCRELVSCHGFPKSNTIVWSYPHLTKVGTIDDNGGRIFGSVLSPDGQTLVTAADENLKFWKIFDPAGKKMGNKFIASVDLR